MCSLIQDTIKKFENQGEKEKLAEDALNAMLELAEQQKDAFYLKVTNPNVDRKLIPIDQILFHDFLVRCDVSVGNTDVGAIINKTYSNFAKGAIANAIGKVLDSGLDLLLGSYKGNTSKREL
ncbi:hypothetical protein LZL87_014010 [Fusarium oxysporum]|nr:hypothetical protein LZL87_014010 [Fusarium oxysporum]